MTTQDIIGMTIVGYRYGVAPECGRSYNTREQEWEPGVSMASVGYCREFGSFAANANAEEGKHYYIGVIAGFGGDNEICLEDVEEITAEQYEESLATYKEQSNAVVNCYADRWEALLDRGFNIGKTYEDIEAFRNLYTKL